MQTERRFRLAGTRVSVRPNRETGHPDRTPPSGSSSLCLRLYLDLIVCSGPKIRSGANVNVSARNGEKERERGVNDKTY